MFARNVALLLVALNVCQFAYAQKPWSYSTYFGGENTDVANAVATDRSGNIYVAGLTNSRGRPFAGTGASVAGFYLFLAKFKPEGAVVYTKTYDAGFGALHVDEAGNVYLTGSLASSSFPTTPNAYRTTGPGGFVIKLAPDGSTLFSTFLFISAHP